MPPLSRSKEVQHAHATREDDSGVDEHAPASPLRAARSRSTSPVGSPVIDDAPHELAGNSGGARTTGMTVEEAEQPATHAPKQAMASALNKEQPTGGNFGAAAALRARLLGGKAPEGAAADTSGARGGIKGPRKETIALPLVDSQGRAAPGAFGRERAGAGGFPTCNWQS